VTVHTQVAALALTATAVLCPAFAAAECGTGIGAICTFTIDVPARPAHYLELAVMSSASASAPTPLVDVGQILLRGEYSIINAEYYGLPPVSDGWVYMRVGQDAYRVDWQSHEVLERVTDEAAANFQG
jgi:hypothetical protein